MWHNMYFKTVMPPSHSKSDQAKKNNNLNMIKLSHYPTPGLYIHVHFYFFFASSPFWFILSADYLPSHYLWSLVSEPAIRFLHIEQ